MRVQVKMVTNENSVENRTEMRYTLKESKQRDW